MWLWSVSFSGKRKSKCTFFRSFTRYCLYHVLGIWTFITECDLHGGSWSIISLLICSNLTHSVLSLRTFTTWPGTPHISWSVITELPAKSFEFEDTKSWCMGPQVLLYRSLERISEGLNSINSADLYLFSGECHILCQYGQDPGILVPMGLVFCYISDVVGKTSS